MEEMKMKTLDALVPPLELCKAAREVIGERTALVWRYIGNEWVVADRKLSVNDNAKYIIPAPTLAELLEIMMENEYLLKHPQVHHDGPDWTVRAFVPGALVHEHDPSNPATAALRLLMKVKGPAV